MYSNTNAASIFRNHSIEFCNVQNHKANLHSIKTSNITCIHVHIYNVYTHTVVTCVYNSDRNWAQL
jgi:hypothetical protein